MPPSTAYHRNALPTALGIAAILLLAAAMTVPTILSKRIDRSADTMAFDAGPSLEYLASIRGETRNVVSLLDVFTDPELPGRPVVTTNDIASARNRLDGWFRAYLTLPALPGEPQLQKTLAAQKAKFDERVDEALVAEAQGRQPEANRLVDEDVVRAADDVVDTSMTILRLDTSNDAALAREIKQTRIAAAWIVRVTCALALLVAALAALLVRRVRAQEREVERRRNEELQAFAARVGHDLRGPLQTIALSLSMAEKSTDPARREDALRRGGRVVQQAIVMVNDLLRFAIAGARPTLGETVEVAAVLQQVAESLRPKADAAKVALLVAPPPSVCVVCARGVLFSVLSNLVENSIKYMRDAATRRVSIAVVPDSARVHITVADTGPGIPPDLAPSVFDPWVRGRSAPEPGFGLGLATVKRLVEAHGGEVGFDSTPGAGTTFWLNLPAAAAADQA